MRPGSTGLGGRKAGRAEGASVGAGRGHLLSPSCVQTSALCAGHTLAKTQRKQMQTPHEAPPAALQRLSPTPALPGPRRPLPRPSLVGKPFTTRQASVSPRGVLGAGGLDWGPGCVQPHGTPGPPCELDLDVTVQAPCSPESPPSPMPVPVRGTAVPESAAGPEGERRPYLRPAPPFSWSWLHPGRPDPPRYRAFPDIPGSLSPWRPAGRCWEAPGSGFHTPSSVTTDAIGHRSVWAAHQGLRPDAVSWLSG